MTRTVTVALETARDERAHDQSARSEKSASRRDFSQEYRLTSRSLPEICDGLKLLVARMGAARRVGFRGRKLTNEAAINAAVLYLCDLPPEAQEAILGRYVARLEAMMNEDPGTDGL